MSRMVAVVAVALVAVWGSGYGGTTGSTDRTASTATDHTVNKHGVMHKTGLTSPMTNCVSCHGANLEGDEGPSCTKCHGKVW